MLNYLKLMLFSIKFRQSKKKALHPNYIFKRSNLDRKCDRYPALHHHPSIQFTCNNHIKVREVTLTNAVLSSPAGRGKVNRLSKRTHNKILKEIFQFDRKRLILDLRFPFTFIIFRPTITNLKSVYLHR